MAQNVPSKLFNEKANESATRADSDSGADADENSESDDEKNNSNPTTTKRQQRMARCGMAFLLQQIRQSANGSTTNSVVRRHGENEDDQVPRKKIKDIKHVASNEQIVHEQLPSTSSPSKFTKVREDSLLPEDEDFYQNLVPLQIMSECFLQGTTPDFGEHIRQLVGENNYVRSCKWSTDGQWLLTDSVDRFVRIFKFDGQQIQLYHKFPFGGLIYDLLWSPNVENLHFISTARGQPIQCWNFDGQLLATFRGINDNDELDSAYSICYSNNGKHIYAGYLNRLRVFDCERVGKQVREIKTNQKGMVSAQKGIVSAITACPTFDGVFAVATYTGSLGLYSMQTGGCDCLIGTNNGPGITHLQYSSDGNRLFVGMRKNPLIHCYDLRMPVRQLASFKRSAYTSQRFHFQLDPYDRYLYSGSSDGKMLIYDVKNNIQQQQEQPIVEPTHTIQCSSASVTGVSLHPHQQLVAICTGQRVFPDWLLHEQLFRSRDDNRIMAAAAAEMGTTLVMRAEKLVDDDEIEGNKERERMYVEFGRGSPLDNAVKLYKLQP